MVANSRPPAPGVNGVEETPPRAVLNGKAAPSSRTGAGMEGRAYQIPRIISTTHITIEPTLMQAAVVVTG